MDGEKQHSEEDLSALEDLGAERLAQIVLDQQQMIGELRAEIDKLKKANEHLRERLDKSEREGKRQAAPFRRKEEKRAEEPSRPGRKEGHEGQARAAPEQVDRHVEVEMEACPCCGGSDSVTDVRPLTQYVEELPPRQVETVELTTYRGECERCGTVETNHPLKTSGAAGAAGRLVGPRAKAVATSLVYDQGMTLSTACGVLEDLFGLRLSRGGLSQLAARAAERLEPKEAELEEAARNADVQYVDETSWWVAGADQEKAPYWLWGFANENQTLYRVDHRRNREVVHEVLGFGFTGVLVSDCLNIYDEATPHQQKCYAHHLKAISAAQAEQKALHGDESSSYLGRLRALLQGAMGLGTAWESLPTERAREYRAGLQESARTLLAPRARSPGPTDAGLTEPEEYVRNRLWKQRDHLFTFLDHDDVAPTNNLAERRLRPAVIQRKLSCGNQTEKGARTWPLVLASLAATYAQKGHSFVKLVMEAFSFEAPQAAVVR